MHAQEAILEKKLSAVYDAIDAGNYKFAVQLCEKTASKLPPSNLFEGLQAFALDKSGRRREAIAICDRVSKSGCTDRGTLQTIASVYKAHKNLTAIVTLYERAVAMASHDIELLGLLFAAHARCMEFGKAQGVAMKLYKATQNVKFFMWYIACLFAESQLEETAPSKKSMNLSLSERMIVKLASEDKLETFDGFWLMQQILTAQGKIAALYDALCGAQARLFAVDKDRKVLQVDLLMQLERWDEARESCGIISQCPDCWPLVNAFISTTIHIGKAEVVQHARHLLQSTLAASGHQTRDALLALLELEKQLIVSKNSEAALTVYAGHMVQFVKDYGSRDCPFEDLKPHLNCLMDAEGGRKVFKGSVLEKLIEHLHTGTSALNDIRAVVNIAALATYASVVPADNFSRWEDVDFQVKNDIPFILHLRHLYVESVKSTASLSLSVTERQLGDDALLLAAHCMIARFNITRDNSLLLEILLWLEDALSRSRYNFQIKLCLIFLHRHFGNHKRCMELYKSLDIKHIQIDTLSYLISDLPQICWLPKRLNETYKIANAVYEEASSDIPEMIPEAFRHDAFSQIPDILAVRARLLNSLQRALLTRGKFRMEQWLQLEAASNKTEIAEVCAQFTPALASCKSSGPYATVESLHDNRDMFTMRSWHRSSVLVRSPALLGLPPSRLALHAMDVVNDLLSAVFLTDRNLLQQAMTACKSLNDTQQPLEASVSQQYHFDLLAFAFAGAELSENVFAEVEGMSDTVNNHEGIDILLKRFLDLAVGEESTAVLRSMCTFSSRLERFHIAILVLESIGALLPPATYKSSASAIKAQRQNLKRALESFIDSAQSLAGGLRDINGCALQNLTFTTLCRADCDNFLSDKNLSVAASAHAQKMVDSWVESFDEMLKSARQLKRLA